MQFGPVLVHVLQCFNSQRQCFLPCVAHDHFHEPQPKLFENRTGHIRT